MLQIQITISCKCRKKKTYIFFLWNSNETCLLVIIQQLGLPLHKKKKKKAAGDFNLVLWFSFWCSASCDRHSRVLSSGHEAREFAVHGPRVGQNSRFWTGQRDTLQTPLHRLRVNQMVSPVHLHQLQDSTHLSCLRVRYWLVYSTTLSAPGTERRRCCSDRPLTAPPLTCGLSDALWPSCTLSDRCSPATARWTRSSRSAKSWGQLRRWEEMDGKGGPHNGWSSSQCLLCLPAWIIQWHLFRRFFWEGDLEYPMKWLGLLNKSQSYPIKRIPNKLNTLEYPIKWLFPCTCGRQTPFSDPPLRLSTFWYSHPDRRIGQRVTSSPQPWTSASPSACRPLWRPSSPTPATRPSPWWRTCCSGTPKKDPPPCR